MKKIVIQETQRGFRFKNGAYVKLLGAGKYYTTNNRPIEIVDLDQPVSSQYCSIKTLLQDPAFTKQTVSIEVGDNELALHYADGNFVSVIPCGKYVFWNILQNHTFTRIDLTEPTVDASIPGYILQKIPSLYLTKIDVEPRQKALVYFDGVLHTVLDAGAYYYWNTSTKIDITYVDTCLTQMQITGQELLTADKVTLRINFVCNYRITDYVKIHSEIDDYAEQLYVTAQLALREYVGKYKLDELLENKDKLSQYVLERIKSKENALYLTITDAGIKDIILPGEIRDIINTVLIAEKQAQANVITRREEVASTRSLLNTAKLMDENQTLYKLKELEFIERICANVGNINVSGNVLAQLTEVLRGTA